MRLKSLQHASTYAILPAWVPSLRRLRSILSFDLGAGLLGQLGRYLLAVGWLDKLHWKRTPVGVSAYDSPFFFVFFFIFYEFVARACKVATPMYCLSILGLGLGRTKSWASSYFYGAPVNPANGCGIVLFKWLLHMLSHACTESFDHQTNDCFDCLTPRTSLGTYMSRVSSPVYLCVYLDPYIPKSKLK